MAFSPWEPDGDDRDVRQHISQNPPEPHSPSCLLSSAKLELSITSLRKVLARMWIAKSVRRTIARKVRQPWPDHLLSDTERTI